MKTTKIALAALCLLLAACKAEVPDSTATPLEYREFTASVEVSPTRTALDGMSVKWDESGETINYIIKINGDTFTLENINGEVSEFRRS